jgi:hypothetical protein
VTDPTASQKMKSSYTDTATGKSKFSKYMLNELSTKNFLFSNLSHLGNERIEHK